MGTYRSARFLVPVIFGIFGLIILSLGVTRAVFSAEQAQIDQTIQAIEANLNERESGEIGVIVQLDLPQAYQQEGHLGSASLVQAQRSGINLAQDAFLSRLPAEGLTPYAQFKTIPFVALKVDQAGLDFLKQSPQVIHIQEDIKFTLSLASSIPVIGATEAWDRGYRGDGQAVVIIDSGLDGTHSFFEDRVVAEACFSNGENEGFTLCPNGEKSQIGSGAASPLTDECQYSGTNLCIHGTHVGGIAAGDGANESGVAPDADVIGIQVFTRIESQECILSTLLPTCISSNFTDILLALEHIYTDLRLEHDIAAINMSLGGESYSDQAVCDAEYPSITAMMGQLKDVGIATVVASGNNGNVDAIAIPSCISSAIAVGATDDSDAVTSFSNMHPMVSLLAPGASINSSVPVDEFQALDGTSMAAPHVAGAWAVMREIYPNASVDEILDILTANGVPIQDQRPGGNTTTPRLDLAAVFGPNLKYDPSEAFYESETGAPFSFSVTLTNSGQAELTWSLVEPEAPALGVTQDEAIRLSHSTSKEIVANNSTSCEAAASSFFRVFDLNEFNISKDFLTSEVEFGVESATSLFISPLVSVKLYTLEGENLSFDNMSLIGQADATVTDQTLSLFSVPIETRVPAGSQLVVELQSQPPLLLETVVFGSNTAGQSAPTYYYAPDCEVDTITDVATVGFPDMHLVLDVVGTPVDPPPACNAWITEGRLAANPTSGTVDPGSTESVTVNVDATGLEPGTYTPHLCLETNSSRYELLRIPINIYITCPSEDTSCVPPTATPEPYPTETPTPVPTTDPGSSLPDAGFTPSTTSGPAPLTVAFTNTSSGEIDSYLWEFGNGETSTEENPSVIYTEPGAYPVKLTATNASGSSSYQLTITALAEMMADFSADVTVIETLPTTITFTNLSTGAYDSCTWEIGDDVSLNGCDTVTHTFDTAGAFDVKLTISGASGVASATKASYITSSPDLPQVNEFFIYMPMMME